MAAKKSGTKAIRYTDAKKRQVLDFVDKTNAKKGRGGIAAAEKKYNISRLTIYRWKNALEGGTTGVSSGGKRSAKKATKKKAAKKAGKKATRKKTAKKATKKAAKKSVKKKATKKKAGKKAKKGAKKKR